MKKIIASIIVIAGFIMYAVMRNNSATAALPVTPSSSTTSSSGSNPQPTATVQSDTTKSGSYKDGEYTGPAVDAFYGMIQVKAVIQGGKLTDVQFLQYPNDQHESIEINTNAMPLLKQEAIAAQSAQVDYVTRATDTTNAFRQSLGRALQSAKS